MSRGTFRSRLIALSLGSLVAFAVVFAVVRSRPSRPTVQLAEGPIIDAAFLAERRSTSTPASALTAPTGRLAFSRDTASRISPLGLPDQQFDPYALLCHAPNLDVRMTFAEHENATWRLRTNSLGLREDRELLPESKGFRILCAGDSHTDGFCDNPESWPHRLEARLGALHPDMGIEAINAGKAMTGPYHYRGVFERLHHLGPKLFIVAIYGGNDFMETVRPWYLLAGRARERYGIEDWKIIDHAKAVDPAGMSQAGVSFYMFHRFPSQIDDALTAVLSLSADIAGAADARGIRPLFLYLPSQFELGEAEPGSRARTLLEALGLGPDALKVHARMVDRYLDGLASLGIASLDLRPHFATNPEALYWHEDLHINVRAHDLIAEILTPVTESMLATHR